MTESPTPPPPVPPAPPTPQPTSGVAVAGGVGGVGIVIYIIDRLLSADGAVAANMLAQLSPLTGPLWASWPVLAAVVLLALYLRAKWDAAQVVRAYEAAAARAATDALARSVAGVADGLAGLRHEVADLRHDLRQHADATDARFAAADSALREHVAREIEPVVTRVAALERRRRRSD